MDQDELRTVLRAIIEERAKAGESLADVGATLAKLTDPPSKPPTRQYMQMLVAGKANITDTLRPRHPDPCRDAGRRDRTPGQRPPGDDAASTRSTLCRQTPSSSIPPTPAGWTAVAWRSSAGAPTAARSPPRSSPPTPRGASKERDADMNTRSGQMVGCYTLDLYCGDESHFKQYTSRNEQFTGPLSQPAFAQLAKPAGPYHRSTCSVRNTSRPARPPDPQTGNTMAQEWYSDLLYRAAKKWGFEIPEPRPLIDDSTSPYVRAAIIEQFRLPGDTPGRYTEISLVTANGRYSFTVCYQWKDRGTSYLPFLKFCDPYPTQDDAYRRRGGGTETGKSTARRAEDGFAH